MKAGQLDDAGLSPNDLRLLIVRMTDTLVNMFHSRIKYPWQNAQSAQSAQNAPPQPGSAAPEPGKTEPRESGTSGMRTVTPAQGTGATVVRLPRPTNEK
jgi:hypothetical protein